MANKKGNKKAEIEYVEDLVPEKKGNVKKAAKNSLSNNKETKKNKNALPIKITAISLAAITLVFIVLSVIVAVSVSTKQIDYIETDLSKYVTLSKSDYIDFPAEITVPQPSEEIHVNNEIAKLLYSYRIPVDGDQAYKRNITISAGDKVSLYYRGYYLNDEGKRVYFDGGCNFNSESSKLEIGSSTTIPGFESGLIGKNQKDYATFDKLTEGNVEKGDIIYITYSATRGDGTEEKSKKAMVDLSDPDLDEKWGVGFKKYWEENTVKLGEKVEKIVVESIKDGAKQDLYLDITPVEAYRIDNSEKEILEVNAMFPANYSNNPDLSGKSVKFEMFIIAAIDYTVPEFDEKFITEKLEVKAEDLADYEGDDIVAKYKNKILTDLTEEYEQAVEDSVSAIFWEYIVKTAKFKSLPQGDVNTYYKNIVAQIESAHTNYEDTYPTLDSFARAYLGQIGRASCRERVFTFV